MESLIQDLLAYAIVTKYEDRSPRGVDSAQVLAAVLETLKGPLEQAGGIVTHTALPVVAMHENRLAQLFQNLIGNALKYRGPETPRVHISASERDGWCLLSVADNGIGIDPKFADSIVGLFKRLHTRDQYPGSGIGLAICQRIVEHYRAGSGWRNRCSREGQPSASPFPLK